jgi:hypothetical protein
MSQEIFKDKRAVSLRVASSNNAKACFSQPGLRDTLPLIDAVDLSLTKHAHRLNSTQRASRTVERLESSRGHIPRRSAAKLWNCNPNPGVREQSCFHTPSACGGVLDSLWVHSPAPWGEIPTGGLPRGFIPLI